MLLKSLVAAVFAASGTVDVPAGTILCKSTATAEALAEAVTSKPSTVAWLMAGACERINVDFPDQALIETEPFAVIEWTNGIWTRPRVIVPAEIADQIIDGRAKAVAINPKENNSW